MNYTSKTIFFLFILSIFLSSCRKGEEDPAISFLSRDARITGLWQLQRWDGTTEQFKDEAWTRETFAYEDEELNYYISGSQSSWIWGSGDMKYELEIGKDGYYSQHFSSTSGGDYDYSDKGSWSWGDSKKNKTRLVMDDFFMLPVNRVISFNILELRNKQLKIQYEIEVEIENQFEPDESLKVRHTFVFKKIKKKD